MTYNLLFHGFGLLDFNYIKTEYKTEGLFFCVENKESKCRKCESSNVIKKGNKIRLFKMISNRFKPSFIKAKLNDLECQCCGESWPEQISIPNNEKFIPMQHQGM